MRRNIEGRIVLDVVEALIDTYLIVGAEKQSCPPWLDINVDFVNVPYARTFTLKLEKCINVAYLEF